jgi:hypothetical protein
MKTLSQIELKRLNKREIKTAHKEHPKIWGTVTNYIRTKGFYKTSGKNLVPLSLTSQPKVDLDFEF